VLIAVMGFLEQEWMSDSGWVYGPDVKTIAIALCGYLLLFLAVLALRRLSRSTHGPARSTVAAGGGHP
jgi:hypothetical protein